MNNILKFKECIHLPNEFVYWDNECRLINAIHYYYEQPFFSVFFRLDASFPRYSNFSILYFLFQTKLDYTWVVADGYGLPMGR